MTAIQNFSCQTSNNGNKKRLRCQDMNEFQRNKKFIEDFGIRNLNISLNHSDDRIDSEHLSPISSSSGASYMSDSLVKRYNVNNKSQYKEPTTAPPADMIFNGSKFVRKVDHLIDNLIRKTRKLHQFPNYSIDSNIPNNVGPQPTTDHAISQFLNHKYVPQAITSSGLALIPTTATYNNNNNNTIWNQSKDKNDHNTTGNQHTFNKQALNNDMNDDNSYFQSSCASNDLSHSDYFIDQEIEEVVNRHAGPPASPPRINTHFNFPAIMSETTTTTALYNSTSTTQTMSSSIDKMDDDYMMITSSESNNELQSNTISNSIFATDNKIGGNNHDDNDGYISDQDEGIVIF